MPNMNQIGGIDLARVDRKKAEEEKEFQRKLAEAQLKKQTQQQEGGSQ